MPVAFSIESRQDLREIAVYIMHDSPVRALSFVEELEARCLSLADYPDRGAARERLLKGLRFVPHGNYNIFYRHHDDDIQIVRILHGARRLRRKDFA